VLSPNGHHQAAWTKLTTISAWVGLGRFAMRASTKKLQAYPSEKSEKQVHEV
jgi:hypothetical protein